jgi:hypothetical protein
LPIGRDLDDKLGVGVKVFLLCAARIRSSQKRKQDGIRCPLLTLALCTGDGDADVSV